MYVCDVTLCVVTLTHCRSYHDPHPTNAAIKHNVNNFCLAVVNSLKLGCIRSYKFNVEFSLEVYRYLFNNRGTAVEHRRGKQYNLADFKHHFPLGWNTYHDKHGDGCTVNFPVIMISNISMDLRITVEVQMEM